MKQYTLLAGGVGLAVAGLLVSSLAHAASQSYSLDDTNTAGGSLFDGTPYLTVTIDDEGDPGLINFTVATTDNLTDAGNFGIQSFAFNVTTAPNPLATTDITGLPDGWAVNSVGATTELRPGNADGYGSFDVVLNSTGITRVDPLTFSIDAAGDDISSYFDLSAGNAGAQPHVQFAAHVTGIDTGVFPTGCTAGDAGCEEISSAWFGGGPPVDIIGPPVPVPAAVWLFGSGLLGLVGVSRRRA